VESVIHALYRQMHVAPTHEWGSGLFYRLQRLKSKCIRKVCVWIMFEIRGGVDPPSSLCSQKSGGAPRLPPTKSEHGPLPYIGGKAVARREPKPPRRVSFSVWEDHRYWPGAGSARRCVPAVGKWLLPILFFPLPSPPELHLQKENPGGSKKGNERLGGFS
jgi:hypothetical protein